MNIMLEEIRNSELENVHPGQKLETSVREELLATWIRPMRITLNTEEELSNNDI